MNFSLVRHKGAYEGDEKTTVRVINQELELGLMVDSYATVSFLLISGINMRLFIVVISC